MMKDQKTWKDLWEQMHPNQDSNHDLPSIDFNKKMIVAIFHRPKSTGGFSVDINKVCKTQEVIKVTVVKESQGRGCNVTMAFSSQYHIIALDKRSERVQFSEHTKIQSCE